MKKFVKGMILLTVIATSLTGCTQNNAVQDQLKSQEAMISKLTAENNALIVEITSLKSQPKPLSLLYSAAAVLELLKAKDFEGLSAYIDDTKGIRFSPYSYIDVENDKVFTKAQIAAISQDAEEYMWGNYDGTGDPIKLNFNDYYNKFIYDKDFVNPDQIGYNKPIGTGNSLDNLSEVYTNSNFIEFYLQGADPSMLDWAGLKLVFEKVQDHWVLVGIVHNQWTI